MQHEICEALGVTAPVVSRMVKALEKQGLLARKAVRDDGRKKRVLLTREGLDRIRRVTGEIEGLGLMQMVLESGYTRPSQSYRFTPRTGRTVHMLTNRLWELATTQGNRGYLLYSNIDPVCAPPRIPHNWFGKPDPLENEPDYVPAILFREGPWEDHEALPSSPDLTDMLAE